MWHLAIFLTYVVNRALKWLFPVDKVKKNESNRVRTDMLSGIKLQIDFLLHRCVIWECNIHQLAALYGYIHTFIPQMKILFRQLFPQRKVSLAAIRLGGKILKYYTSIAIWQCLLSIHCILIFLLYWFPVPFLCSEAWDLCSELYL